MRFAPALSLLRGFTLVALTAGLLAGCAANTATVGTPDFSSLSTADKQTAVAQLAERYSKKPSDKGVVLAYAAALRSAGQSEQAGAVLETALDTFKDDKDVKIAYAKSLVAQGRFNQALNIIDSTIVLETPDWNALSVKGAILDQMGRNRDARALYQQALLMAPNEASLEANLGLSYSMTNELPAAEEHLRRAAEMPGSTSQIRQNLALVVGLQGRFDEAEALFAAELPPDQVEANLAYVKALLTEQDRWQAIQQAK